MMKKLTITLLSGLTFAGLSVAGAEEAAKKCEKECKKECETTKASDCASCPLTKAMADLPKISYVIAGEASACAASATAAAEAGKEVKYVVAGKELCCPTAAKYAHVEAVEEFVASFASTHACSDSGKTFVGNKGYDCSQHASTMAAAAKKAMDDVKTVYVVAGKEFCCASTASETAKNDNAKVTYVVADQKTECAQTNRMNVAIAKYKAAIQCLIQAEAPVQAEAPAAEASKS
ncbi:MAG: hypothetical protein O3C21_06150 [Verrucomicrobia bacterium]|nr:hypothetical protein [Verrucomicrobiota bacterium]